MGSLGFSLRLGFWGFGSGMLPFPCNQPGTVPGKLTDLKVPEIPIPLN